MLDKDGVLSDVIKPAKYSFIEVSKKISKNWSNILIDLPNEQFKSLLKQGLMFQDKVINNIPTYLRAYAYVLTELLNGYVDLIRLKEMFKIIEGNSISLNSLTQSFVKFAYEEPMFEHAVNMLNILPNNIPITVISSSEGVTLWMKKELKRNGIDKSICIYERIENKTNVLYKLSLNSVGLFFTDSISDVIYSIRAREKGSNINVYGVLTGLSNEIDFYKYNVNVFDNVLEGVNYAFLPLVFHLFRHHQYNTHEIK